MVQKFLVLILYFLSATLNAAPLTCLNSLRSLQGLNPNDLSKSYLLKVNGTLSGELDPYALGEGGVISATLITDGGKAKPISSPNITFVLFERDESHPKTTKVDKSFYNGWTFLLLKRSCVVEMQNKKQIRALNELVTRHMNPAQGTQLKFLSFE